MSMAAVHRRYEQALEWLVIALMAVLAIEVVTGVAFRSAGYSLAWYDEVASILLAWLTFYGSALASVKRAHIGCPELVALLPPAPRMLARLVVELLVIVFFQQTNLKGGRKWGECLCFVETIRNFFRHERRLLS